MLVQSLRAEVQDQDGAVPPVVLMTATDPPYDPAVSPAAVLRKPFDLSDLEGVLSRFLG
jgi:hypothetical protein